MSEIRQRWKQMIPWGITFAMVNLYFFFFIQGGRIGYLVYLDILLLIPLFLLAIYDCQRFQKREKEKKRLMAQKEIMCRILPPFENQDIARHDVEVMEEQLALRFEENCDLQDYVAKWCHELKLPLSALFLMNEKIGDRELKMAAREQLEKMNQQVQAMLLGCRLQSPLLDIQIKKVQLLDCVKTSVHNNQFFLIQKGFELEIQVGEVSVYTDSAWLVYSLDQLLSNAVKYGQSSPCLRIWAWHQDQIVKLFIEDNGEGIKDRDIGRIFEKGFTGSSYHNGKYKSTGMGLYMVSKVLDRLGHEIHVESEYGKFTRFSIVFKENPYFFR